jgi:hypothetical protein
MRLVACHVLCTHQDLSVCVCVCLCVCMFVCVCLCVCVCVCVCVFVWVGGWVGEWIYVTTNTWKDWSSAVRAHGSIARGRHPQHSPTPGDHAACLGAPKLRRKRERMRPIAYVPEARTLYVMRIYIHTSNRCRRLVC